MSILLTFVAALSVTGTCYGAVVPAMVAGCMPLGQLPAGCPETIGGDCPRCYNNTMPDYTPGASLLPSAATLDVVKERHAQYLGMLLRDNPPGTSPSAEVYLGSAGTALQFLKLYHRTSNHTYLLNARLYVDAAMKTLPDLTASCKKQGYVSFMWAPSGVYAVAAVTYSLLEDAPQATAAIHNLYDIVVANDAQHNDFLPGRAGLLFAVRFVTANNPLQLPLPWTNADLLTVAHSIVKAGTANGEPYMSWKPPSNMQRGLGTTHGTCGVLHELLQVPHLLDNATVKAAVVATLDHVVSMQFTTGNFPEQYEEPLNDVLVQWDHGAPGVSVTLFIAGKLLNNPVYTASAEKAQDCVWRRGLLTKGLQNCHGISGNVFTMVMAYQLTGDAKYLYRASRFVEFMTHPSISDPSLMRQMQPASVSWMFWPASYQAALFLWTDFLSAAANGTNIYMTGYQAQL